VAAACLRDMDLSLTSASQAGREENRFMSQVDHAMWATPP
jgi:hypothetical protein